MKSRLRLIDDLAKNEQLVDACLENRLDGKAVNFSLIHLLFKLLIIIRSEAADVRLQHLGLEVFQELPNLNGGLYAIANWHIVVHHD